jgi:branched-chain amino acid transport system substrate-binding protein
LASKLGNLSHPISAGFQPQTIIRAPRAASLLRSCLILLTLLIATTFAPSCARPQENAPDHSLIKIGFFGDLSGPTFNFGQSAMNGVLLAADEINQAGGINGHKIDVVIEDDKGSPEAASQLTGKLIGRDKVVAIIGAGASGNSLASSAVSMT